MPGFGASPLVMRSPCVLTQFTASRKRVALFLDEAIVGTYILGVAGAWLLVHDQRGGMMARRGGFNRADEIALSLIRDRWRDNGDTLPSPGIDNWLHRCDRESMSPVSSILVSARGGTASKRSEWSSAPKSVCIGYDGPRVDWM